MSQLILMRHGESQWNFLNLFTGWVDIALSPKGIEEALLGGELIKNEPVDRVFTSSLVRAQTTAILAMSRHASQKPLLFEHKGIGRLNRWGKCYSEEARASCIPVTCSWHLNERMYGKLQGCNKDAMRKKFGEKQVKLWRRSFDIRPPGGESLQLTAKRTIPYFQNYIIPCLRKDENIFIAAHGNSLRSIVMHIENLSTKQVLELEIPTGKPLFYSFNNGKFIKKSS